MIVATDKRKDWEKQMVEAIRLGRLQEVVDRVQAHPGIVHHTNRISGLTLLHLAAFHGQVPIATYLLDHGAVSHLNSSPLHPTYNRKLPSALFIAALMGHADMAHLLLSYDADPNLGSSASTPLMAASARGFVKVVRCLLKHRLGRAGVNLANKCGQTALWLACREGRVKVVWDLLDAGADMRMGPPGGPTALAVALAPCATVLRKFLERRFEEPMSHGGVATARSPLPRAAEYGGGLRPVERGGLKRAREEEGVDKIRSRLARHRTSPLSSCTTAPPPLTVSFSSIPSFSGSGSSAPPSRPLHHPPLFPASSISQSLSPHPYHPYHHGRHHYDFLDYHHPRQHDGDKEKEGAASRLKEWQRLSYMEWGGAPPFLSPPHQMRAP